MNRSPQSTRVIAGLATSALSAHLERGDRAASALEALHQEFLRQRVPRVRTYQSPVIFCALA